MCALPFENNSFKGIYCNHDSINYLMTEELVLQHFNEVYRVLDNGGIYIFDVSTEQNVIKNYHCQTIKKHKSGVRLVWDNYYDYDKRIITSVLNFYPKKLLFTIEKNNEIYTEIHLQKIYTDIELRNLFEKVGFKLVSNTADYNLKRHLSDAGLMVYVLKKN